MRQLIEIIEELRLRGIGLRSLTEALDTTTAQGRLVIHMFGALAEFERSLIRERPQDCADGPLCRLRSPHERLLTAQPRRWRPYRRRAGFRPKAGFEPAPGLTMPARPARSALHHC